LVFIPERAYERWQLKCFDNFLLRIAEE